MLTRYRDVAVTAMASIDREQTAAFVTRVLGRLAADEESTYRIATTLAVYLEENRSPARAAQRLRGCDELSKFGSGVSGTGLSV